MANVQWFRESTKIWIAGAAIALILLWGIENAAFNPYPDLQLFIKELAFALLISCVFGLTIEQVQRSEFIRLVTEERDVLKKDVFLYAYGSNLHEQVRNEIRSSILESPYYRENLVMDWEFCPPDAANLMSVKKRYSYTLVNNGNEAKEWPFKFIQIGADDVKAVAECKLIVLKVTRGKTTTEYKPEQMETTPTPGQPHMKRFETPIALKASESVGIYYELMQARKLSGEDKYNCRDPVVGISRVKLRFPAKSEFEVSVSCKTKPFEIAPDSDGPTFYSFEYEGGLLPYQGISVSWSTKCKTSAQENDKV